MQLGVSFLLAVIFFYWVFFIVRRVHQMELAIIPGGDAMRLVSLRFIKWKVLTSPDQVRAASVYRSARTAAHCDGAKLVNLDCAARCRTLG